MIPACHGIRVEPADLGLELGWVSVPPWASVEVTVADEVVRGRGAELIWEIVVPAPSGLPAVTTQGWREPGGAIFIGNSLDICLRVDFGRSSVTIAALNNTREEVLEGLASVALPVYAHQAGALIMHGAAASRDGRGTLLCADGGSGKSSLLTALVGAGWNALSEDQCVLEWSDSGNHRLWPGPSWVRLRHGVPPAEPVASTQPRFDSFEKFAWDLREWMSHEPVQLERIVLLEPPGGEDVVWERVPSSDQISRLMEHVTWARDEQDFHSSTFLQVVRIALEVPAFRMRLPRQPNWLQLGVDVLDRD